MLKKFLSVFIIFISSSIFAQGNQSDETLFTVADEIVTVKEFVRVYTKNNINNQADFSKKSLEEYLDLYKKFKLKVKEAESLKMDTSKTFVRELASYRTQLAPSYLTDKKASEKLVMEAYNRMQEEVSVSHILIFWPNKNPSKADSTVVLKEIKAIKAAAEKNSFESQVRLYSSSNRVTYPNKQQKYEAGRLGYITVFQTVYPFENAMYTTPVGGVSEPVATRFGYHLVYVKDKRKARGKIQAAQLLVKSKSSDSKENQDNAKAKAKQIYDEIQSGSINFEEAVKKYSEDKRTKYQNGKLPILSSSQMLEPFANAVFTLEKDGDMTSPVKTAIGWHIIKRIKKEEIPGFDIAKNDLEKKVAKDSRSFVAKEKVIADTKEKFGFSTNEIAKEELIQSLNKNKGKAGFKLKEAEVFGKMLFKIGTKEYTQNDFIGFLSKQNTRKSAANDLYSKFESEKIMSYREQHLEEIVEEFKNLMQEYHDGILLFELTNKEVWNKAVEDTTGLKQFFKENKANYVWKDRLAYTSYTAKNTATAEKLKKFLKKGKNQDFILAKLNKKEEMLKAKQKLEEKDSNEEIKSLKLEQGFMFEEKNLDGSVKLLYVDEVLAPSQKELNETRGYVISDYQNQLEKNWLVKLAKKFPIKVNQSLFESLVKQQ